MSELGAQAHLPDSTGDLIIAGWQVQAVGNRICRDGQTVRLEPRTMAVLLCLAATPGQVVTRAELENRVWQGAVVGYDVVSHAITKLRKAFGDDSKHSQIVETIPKVGYRLIAEVTAVSSYSDATDGALERIQPATPGSAASGPRGGATEPFEVRYCTTVDGVHLAYAETGDGPSLIKAGSFLTHLQYDSEGVLFRQWIDELAKDFRYIRYDARGNGLSDWNVDGFSFDTMVADLEAVVDELHLDRVALFGISQGASVTLEYAHRHPGRVACLIIYGGYAAGWRHSTNPKHRARRQAMLELAGVAWDDANPAARQVYSSLFLPEGTPEEHREFERLLRTTTTPENAYRILDTFGAIDVRAIVPRIRVPTLIMHCRDDAVVPFEAGRELATKIPGARFVSLDGCNHIIRPSDPAWPRFIAEIRRFVAEHL